MSLRACFGLLATLAVTGLAGAPGASGQTRFQHERHRSIACTECHGNGRATSVSNESWCASCHHVEVGVTECERCHEPSELLPEPGRVLVTFDLPGRGAQTRSLTFDHGPHLEVGCGSCHSGGAVLTVERPCASCHAEHHQATSRCASCHAEPPVTAHPEEVHLDLAGCATAGCHVSEGLDFAALAETERTLCLSCHVAQEEHEAPGPCGECHMPGQLPDPPGSRR